jgi:hypothetical protein
VRAKCFGPGQSTCPVLFWNLGVRPLGTLHTSTLHSAFLHSATSANR